LTELVQAGVALGVPPLDPVALAAAVVELLRVPDKCQRLGEAGRALVEERYDVRLTARRYEALYDELLDASRHPNSGPWGAQ
jgi:glycosyltransferase involved in cell wall biosynthesis